MTTTNNLIQILLPTNGGHDGVFERLAQELTAKFGGVTSFIRAPAEGRWNAGSHDVDYGYWSGLRTRLEHALSHEEIVIRCQSLELL